MVAKPGCKRGRRSAAAIERRILRGAHQRAQSSGSTETKKIGQSAGSTAAESKEGERTYWYVWGRKVTETRFNEEVADDI